MRRARIRIHGEPAAVLDEVAPGESYHLTYGKGYRGPPVSLTLPVREEPYEFDAFPAFLDGLLPEGVRLEALLRLAKIDRADLLGQIFAVGEDLVGAVTVHALESEDGA